MKINFNKTQASFLILFFLLLALPVGLYLSRQPQQLKSRAFDRGTVGLQLSPATSDPSTPLLVNRPLEVVLQINAGDYNKVTGADIKVKYSDTLNLTGFEADSQASLDKLVLSNFDPTVKNGFKTFHYIAVTSASSVSAAGLVNVGKLKFITLREGQATVIVTDEPVVTAAAQASKLSVNKEVRSNGDFVYTEGTYTIGSVTVTPTPTGVSSQCVNGDIGDNNCVDNADFAEWFKQFTGIGSDRNLRGEFKSDFYPLCQNGRRGDGIINGADLNVWIRESGGENRCR